MRNLSGNNQYGDRHLQVLRHQQHLDDFLTYVGLDRTEATVDSYRTKIRPMLRVWDAIPIEQWNKVLFERYIALGKAGKHPGQVIKWTPRSVQLLIIAVRLFGQYLQSHGVPVQDFWSSAKKPKLHQDEAKFFTMEQTRRLLEAAHGTKWVPFLALGLGAGMRRAEIMRATWEDCDFASTPPTIVVHRKKVGFSHRIRMTPFLHEVLLPIRKDSGPIVEGNLNNASRDWKALRNAAGIEEGTPHSLRHGFASELLDQGVPVHVVARAGGWANPTVLLKRYAHLLDGAMDDALGKLA